MIKDDPVPPTLSELLYAEDSPDEWEEIDYESIGNQCRAVYRRAADDTVWQLSWDANLGIIDSGIVTEARTEASDLLPVPCALDGGWTVDVDLLSKVASQCEGDPGPALETVEEVILALAELGYVKLEDA